MDLYVGWAAMPNDKIFVGHYCPTYKKLNRHYHAQRIQS